MYSIKKNKKAIYLLIKKARKDANKPYICATFVICQIFIQFIRHMKKITIDAQAVDQRFDRFLRKYFKHTPEIGLGDIFSWIRK